MDETRLELKVGALLLAAVVAGVGLLALMGELSFGGGITLKVDFSHTGNVVRGAPVKLGGFQVGKVDGIALLADRRDGDGEPLPVQMTVSLSPEALKALREDMTVTISSQGPLGEPYLELNPGNGKGGVDPSKPRRGMDPLRIDVVTTKLARFLEAASGVLENDPNALTNLVRGISGLTRTVDGVLTENRDDVRAIASELKDTAKDLRALAALARGALEPGGRGRALLDDAAATAKVLRADVPELSKNASVALGGLARLSGGFTQEDNAKARATLERAAAVMARLDGTAETADRILRRIDNGEGTLGMVIKDPRVYEDLRALLNELKGKPWKLIWKD